MVDPNPSVMCWVSEKQSSICVGWICAKSLLALWHLAGAHVVRQKNTHTHRVHNVVYLRDESLSLRCWRHTQSPRTCKREHIYYIHLQAIWQRVNQIHFWALQIKVLSMHAQYVSCVYVWFECEWAMVNTVDAAQHISHIRRISGPEFVLARAGRHALVCVNLKTLWCKLGGPRDDIINTSSSIRDLVSIYVLYIALSKSVNQTS